MKKIIIALISSITAVSLCGCDGSQMNVDALLEAQDTLSTYADQLEEMEEYVGTIQDSVSEGVDSVNQLMDWYNNEAWAGNPYISSPISEEEVENLIEIGRDEAESYIDPNASYGVLTDEDIDFYTEYFMAPENYGFILSTYEKPEDCDVNQVFANGAGVETELTASEKKSKKLKDYACKIDKDDVEAILNKNLGIDSDALTTPIEYIESGDTSFLAIPEYDVTPLEYVCRGGFHYNDLNLIMMCTGDLGEPPFAVTIFTRNGEDIKILKNYYSEDMEGLEFDGTFLYELYDLMQDSDVAAVMRIPADDGELYLGSVFEKGVGLSKNSINKAATLISDRAQRAKTYLQEFDGYEVYYSNENPDVEGEILDDYIVSQIVVTSGDFTTAEGIGIGSLRKDIEECYGVGIEIKLAGGRKQLMYQNGKYDMVFTLDKDGVVEEMSLFLASSEEKK